MLFNSVDFVVLVSVSLIIYYLVKRVQIYVLIVSSLTFYAFSSASLLSLLITSASLNAIFSFLCLRAKGRRGGLFYATAGVFVNLAVLAAFKYSPMFGRMIQDIASLKSLSQFLLLVPLPIGISFYTFQGISLLVDTYKGNATLCVARDNIRQIGFLRHYRDTLLFISFFPQLVSGPIVKAHVFYPQIEKKNFRDVNLDLVTKELILGYFLKCVVADNIQGLLQWFNYLQLEVISSANLVAVIFGYSIRIFADFAGYSLIAIGVARLFGYSLPSNFNYPYISSSFSEFWTRWHISLSSFLKEYLYIPIGGNRKGKIRTYINLMLVMTLGGLWHGASGVYLLWGVYHGLLLSIERVLGFKTRACKKVSIIGVVRIFIVFLAVSVGWLFFFLSSTRQVIDYLLAILNNFDSVPVNRYQIFMIAMYSIPVILYHIAPVRKRFNGPLTYGLLLFMVATNSGAVNSFVYFRF